MTFKVVTITLNPALDLTGALEHLNLGKVSLVNESNFRAAGKGVNVAKVLSDLGAQVTVTGFLGQDNQEKFCQLFQQMGANDEFIRVEGATRINVKLVEANGRVNDINFPGVEVKPEHIQRFEHTLLRMCNEHDYFVLSGSLPNGVSALQCAEWIKMLQERGKTVLFDSSKEALKVGIRANPSFVKPNEDELEEITGEPSNCVDQIVHSSKLIQSLGVENVFISMGASGVIYNAHEQIFHALPPKMDVVSTVGAGDTFVAGYCWAKMNQMSVEETLTFSTALSALAVTQVGVGVNELNKVREVQKQVRVERKD
ncbi:1-phosphofructokinase [Vibrio sonorensis]|uniref:1-phosphofructokinase n=1 Tax=Vibrio sonorensis TaxID=1004316 RepID=UPI0008D94B08|nr:1-phosphofructokinase [Vibrio sonorensis]